ncbi:hypothetical protein ACTXOR_08280 [Arthrobacter rhombi]|uniref:hypothetical protein n=1 Tax=Arthrobacter rhombi TaxID=71253 RepID=UPI003FD4B13A
MPEGLPHVNIPAPEQAVAWLSQHRYEKYLALASGDHLLAMEIYAWNSELSSAILRDLAHVEVAVRNAFDASWRRTFLVGQQSQNLVGCTWKTAHSEFVSGNEDSTATG